MNLKINWFEKIGNVMCNFMSYILSWCIIIHYTFFGDASERWFKIRKFEHNGFYGENLPGFTPHKAKFESWTSDPGVAKWLCSDGQYRSIPTFAIYNLKYKKLPKQTYPEGKIMFGASSKS